LRYFVTLFGYVTSDVWMTGWMMNLKGLETFKDTKSAFARRY